jgi:hypothetical protein
MGAVYTKALQGGSMGLARHIASRYSSSSMLSACWIRWQSHYTINSHLFFPYQTINTQAVNWYILTYLNIFPELWLSSNPLLLRCLLLSSAQFLRTRTILQSFLMLSKFSDQFNICINEFIYALNFPNHKFYEFVFSPLLRQHMQTTRYISNWSHDMCQLCHRQQILRTHWAIQMPIIAIYLNWILFCTSYYYQEKSNSKHQVHIIIKKNPIPNIR